LAGRVLRPLSALALTVRRKSETDLPQLLGWWRASSRCRGRRGRQARVRGCRVRPTSRFRVRQRGERGRADAGSQWRDLDASRADFWVLLVRAALDQGVTVSTDQPSDPEARDATLQSDAATSGVEEPQTGTTRSGDPERAAPGLRS
jgi:hypothetical protein